MYFLLFYHLKTDFIQSCERMWKQSVWTSVIAANLAAKHLKEEGLLQLTGAKACLESTPGLSVSKKFHTVPGVNNFFSRYDRLRNG